MPFPTPRCPSHGLPLFLAQRRHAIHTSNRSIINAVLTLFALTLLFLASPSFAATTYYVSPTGNDNNAGTQAAPFKTIQQGINVAVTGDTVMLAAGTYTGPGDVDLDMAGKNLTVNSVSGAAATIINCGGTSSVNHRGFYIHTHETNAVVSGLTIKNGYESNYGGAIDIEGGSTVTLTGCTLTNNTVSSGSGGGVYNTGTATLKNCSLSGNTGFSGGGGVSNNTYYFGTVTLTNCTLTNNTASYGGGGGVFSLCTVTLTGCTLTNNTAPNGGGLCIFGTATLTGCTLSSNTASYGSGGGGVYNNGTATLTNCSLAGNAASSGSGGGFYNYSTATLTNCVVASNTATSGNGGGVYNAYQVTLQFCTLAGNSTQAAGTQGGALENDGTATLTDDILWGNTAPYAGEIGILASRNPVTTATYSDVQGGLSGTSNINADPLFVNPSSNFHLTTGSPALGAGSAITGVTTDLDGKTRGNPPTIGAYEGIGGIAANATTHLLWTNTSGAFALWTITGNGSYTSTPAYGPFSGWAAAAIADGSDGATRVLLRHSPNGQAAVWTVTPTTGTYTSTPGYGPYGDWTARALAVGSDNQTRLLWKNGAGSSSVWTLDSGNNISSTPAFGPYGDWSAQTLAVGNDNQTRLLWKNGAGSSAIWTLDSVGNFASTSAYGPYGDWSAQAVAVGGDNQARLLWKNGSASSSVWTLGSGGGYTSTPAFGPYGGWTAQALAAGGDNLTRLLWSDGAGDFSVWTVGLDGSIASTPAYAPGGGWNATALSVGR